MVFMFRIGFNLNLRRTLLIFRIHFSFNVKNKSLPPKGVGRSVITPRIWSKGSSLPRMEDSASFGGLCIRFRPLLLGGTDIRPEPGVGAEEIGLDATPPLPRLLPIREDCWGGGGRYVEAFIPPFIRDGGGAMEGGAIGVESPPPAAAAAEFHGGGGCWTAEGRGLLVGRGFSILEGRRVAFWGGRPMEGSFRGGFSSSSSSEIKQILLFKLYH